MTRHCTNCGTLLDIVFFAVCDHALCLACLPLVSRRTTSHTCQCADVDTSGPLDQVMAQRQRERTEEVMSSSAEGLASHCTGKTTNAHHT